MIDKNIQRLKHIVKYCEKISSAIQGFDKAGEIFFDEKNYRYRDLVSFYLLQIGELSNGLTDDFKQAHVDIPWREIRGFRNIVAHKYGTIDRTVLWEIAQNDVPVLNQKCRQLIRVVDPTVEISLEKELLIEMGISKEDTFF